MGLQILRSPVRLRSYPFLVGVVGNISACHADARGSIPRRGAFLDHLFWVQPIRRIDRFIALSWFSGGIDRFIALSWFYGPVNPILLVQLRIGRFDRPPSESQIESAIQRYPGSGPKGSIPYFFLSDTTCNFALLLTGEGHRDGWFASAGCDLISFSSLDLFRVVWRCAKVPFFQFLIWGGGVGCAARPG